MLARMEENCIVSFTTNNTEEPIEKCPKVVLEGFQDYSLTLLGLNSPWIVFLIVCQIVCVTMNVAGKIFIMWFVKFKSIDRPMNALIIIDEGIQVAPVLVRGIGTTCSLILKKPLVNLIGHIGCKIWLLFGLTHNLSLVIGGAGMAAYRLSIYKWAHM